jgi:hemerythrin superfamily protein
MNAIDLLMGDHRVVEKLFSEFKTATVRRWDELFDQVYSQLTVHTEMEELEFYPALASIVPDRVDHSIDEHSMVKSLLEELHAVDDKGQGSFEKRFGDLMMEVQKHIREEEEPGGLMDIARQHIDEFTLANIGERMTRIKNSKAPKAA